MHERLAIDLLSGPAGPEIGAFFAFDGTLIDGYSAAAFLQDRARRRDISLGEATKLKKGAFHMAMQGGVPIVAVVIRNAGELLWRGSKVMRSGAVDVHVHEPISVQDWTRDTLNERIAEVRALFVRTHEDRPAADA
jgi:1-acyl-sn-glycerol-3-phosphate acyltransferase